MHKQSKRRPYMGSKLPYILPPRAEGVGGFNLTVFISVVYENLLCWFLLPSRLYPHFL
jgi:hypothetical protein